MADRRRVIDRRTVFLFDECTLARFPNAIGHHVHRVFERNLCPLSRARRAIFHFHFPARMREQLIRSCSFGTKISLADRTLRIALN